jgi:[1-hydroxy-2-(trimethylamino)ethyl]phosphonate dioxygenase
MPGQLDKDLHDRHEEKGHQFLKNHFGDAVAEPVKLHVAAKRYLCTTDPTYDQQLSPTSLKSFKDQGGRMSLQVLREFEQNPYQQEALQLRRWDDVAKVPGKAVPTLDTYLPQYKACLADTKHTY